MFACHCSECWETPCVCTVKPIDEYSLKLYDTAYLERLQKTIAKIIENRKQPPTTTSNNTAGVIHRSHHQVINLGVTSPFVFERKD